MKKLLLLLMTVPIIGFSQCISGDCGNGYGTYLYSGEWEGQKYVGEHKNGKRHGQGTYTYVSGNKYVGEWKYGKRHGQGAFTFANGDKYIGEYKDGQKNGLGVYTYSDGKGDLSYYINGKEIKRVCDF